METEGRFATRLHSLEETPQPFRAALLDRLDAQDSVRFLAFNPSHGSQGFRSPATLLTLTDHRWLLVSDDDSGGTAVAERALDDTLLVEMEDFLLDGRLKIDYAAGGTAHSCTIEFNTISDKPYIEAVRLILQGVEGGPAAASSDRPATAPVIEMKPIIFHNTVPAILAEGRCPVAGVQWPTVHSSYGRELAPAAALLTTDRELVLISEKRVRMYRPRQIRVGYIATFVPLVRLARFGFRRHERYRILDLRMHACHGEGTFQIVFPADREKAVEQVLECALRQSAEFFSALGSS
jgi:hypothetical protein